MKAQAPDLPAYRQPLLPDDYGETVDKVLGALQVDAEYRDLADGIVENGPLNLGRIWTAARSPITLPSCRPGPSRLQLGSDDSRIYDLVVRQFLASLVGPTTWATVERLVELEVADGDNAIFENRGSLKSRLLAALGQKAEAGNRLPALVPGSRPRQVDVAVLEGGRRKAAKPRSRYTDGLLASWNRDD